MKNADVIRAWKSEEYRLSLSEAQRSMVPTNPAGAIELTDAELDGASGGGWGSWFCTMYIGCTSVICPW